MGDMAAGIRRSNGQQVDHEGEQSQINQLDPSDQEQADLQVLPIEGYGKNNRHHRSRSAHQIAIGGYTAEIREYIVSQQEQHRAGNTAQQIQTAQLAFTEEIQEQPAEPVQPKHIEQDMQEVEMREHIGKDRPGPVQQQVRRRRHLQILQERESAQIEQHQDHTRQPYHDEQADVDIDQLRQDIPGIEGLLEIKNIAHC